MLNTADLNYKNLVWITESEAKRIKAAEGDEWLRLVISLRGDAIKPLLVEGFVWAVVGSSCPSKAGHG